MGVDYSSSMVDIKYNHAYDIKNFLKINNVLRNRNGYEQVGKYKINGIWECNYLGEKVYIAHIGNSFYRITDIDKYDNKVTNYLPIYTDNDKVKDDYSWGVFTNDRLYILCGKYYVIKFSKNTDTGEIEFKVNLVFEDEDTYVPTTTINITDAKATKLEINRETLDEPNMMTNWRYNLILPFCGYEINENNEQISTWGSEFELDVSANAFDINSLILEIPTEEGIIETKIVETKVGELIPQTIYNIVNKDDENQILGKVGGNDTFMFQKRNTIFLDNEKIKYNSENSQITAKFRTKSNDYELIDNCTFGIMYGSNGLRNRLFLTGNPDAPNVDYHSSKRNVYATDKDKDLQDSQDLTYFSVYDYCAYGTSNSKITDYQISGNGDLLVLKESNPNETSIYFRSGGWASDSNGNIIEQYPLKSGNIGRGSMIGHKNTLKNLNNDFLFVNDNGVFGISSTVSSSMLNSPYKYSYPRSNLINAKLSEYLLEATSVTTIVDNSKYFITIKLNDNSYKTFVADGRYSYKLQESIDNEYEYEWFVLDNINADKYYILNNKLYYTNDKGLYKLDLYKKVEKHVDIDKFSINEGEVEVDTNDDLTVSELAIEQENVLSKLSNNSEFEIETHNLYDVAIIPIESSQTLVDWKVSTYFSNSDKHYLYIKRLNSNTITRVYPKENEYEFNTYSLYLDKDREQLLTGYEDGNYMLLVKIEQETFTFNINQDQDSIRLINKYGYEVVLVALDSDNNVDTSVALTGTITTKSNVECYLLTKAFNMGQSLYNKNLKSITVVNDVENYSFVNMAIRTKKVKERFKENVISGTKGIIDTYQNIFKADLTNHTFATSFTKDYFIKFNFIQFEFYNLEGSDCIINNINIVYTLGFKQGGVS